MKISLYFFTIELNIYKASSLLYMIILFEKKIFKVEIYRYNKIDSYYNN